MHSNYQTEFDRWIEQEKNAVELMNLVGKLWFDRSIELLLFRQPLFDISSSQVLANHEHARRITNQDIDIHLSLQLVQSIAALDLAPSRIDIGRLATEWIGIDRTGSVPDFIARQLAGHIGQQARILTPKDVVLYGFGRIGRIAARELISQAGKGEQLRLRAIVTRSYSDEELTKRAELLRKDSVHGAFKGTISEDHKNKTLIINGQTIQMIQASAPESIDYTQYDIKDALVIDNTGAFRDREQLSRHLKSKGVSKVLLTAPGKGDIPNVVTGVNDQDFDFHTEDLFSNASCTTNAIVPVLKVIDAAFGIEKGHIETVHSYTNDQNLLDNYHKKYRRGRSAALNLVITETGAAKAVAKVLPRLAGRLTGNAVRVPTANVSLAILNLTFDQKVNREEVNALLKEAALFGSLSEQLDYSVSNELVSSDLIGNSHASILDSPATIVSEDRRSVVLYVWYDNEYGYTRQVIRFAKKIAGVVRLTYY